MPCIVITSRKTEERDHANASPLARETLLAIKKKREFRLAMKLQRRREYPTIRKRDYKKINEHLYKIQKEDSNRGAENEYAD